MSAHQDGSGTFLRPFQDALARVHKRETLRVDQLEARARGLMIERFGESDMPATCASAPGHVSLLAEHTHYFDGFGLVLPIPYGTAVVLRSAKPEEAYCFDECEHQQFPLTEEATARQGSTPSTNHPAREALIRSLSARTMKAQGSVQACIVTTIPECCADGAMAALAVAWDEAAAELNPDSVGTSAPGELSDLIDSVLERPFGVVPILGAMYVEDGEALLLDAQTKGHIGVGLPSRDHCIFGIVDVKLSTDQTPGVFDRRKEQSESARSRLHVPGMPPIESFRDLEHRHLVSALARLPNDLQPVARYLVSENRRVQRAVTAIRKEDMQILGGHLLMSQASLRDDWGEQNDAVEQVRVLAESREGIYGVRRTGRELGTAVLVLGKPLAVAQLMEAVERQEHPTGITVQTMLL